MTDRAYLIICCVVFILITTYDNWRAYRATRRSNNAERTAARLSELLGEANATIGKLQRFGSAPEIHRRVCLAANAARMRPGNSIQELRTLEVAEKLLHRVNADRGYDAIAVHEALISAVVLHAAAQSVDNAAVDVWLRTGASALETACTTLEEETTETMEVM